MKNIGKIPDVRQYGFWENSVISINSNTKKIVIYNSGFSEKYDIEGEYHGFVINGNLLLDSQLKAWDLEKKNQDKDY